MGGGGEIVRYSGRGDIGVSAEASDGVANLGVAGLAFWRGAGRGVGDL